MRYFVPLVLLTPPYQVSPAACTPTGRGHEQRQQGATGVEAKVAPIACVGLGAAAGYTG